MPQGQDVFFDIIFGLYFDCGSWLRIVRARAHSYNFSAYVNILHYINIKLLEPESFVLVSVFTKRHPVNTADCVSRGVSKTLSNLYEEHFSNN